MNSNAVYKTLMNIVCAIFLLGVIPGIAICAFGVFLVILCGLIYILPYVIFFVLATWALKCILDG